MMGAAGDSFTYNGIKYEVLDEAAKTVTTAVGYDMDGIYYPGNTYSGDLIFPSVVENNGVQYTLTVIGSNGFSDQKNLTSVEIPNTVTVIDNYAFIECSSLAKVIIPASVKEIGSSGFGQCPSLKRVDITDLGAWCAIDFGSSKGNPLYYGADFYVNGEMITELVIPETVARVEDYTFCQWKGLTSVVFPNTLREIGRRSFESCPELTKITIGSAVSKIDSDAFADCKKLEEIVSLAVVPPTIDDDTFSDYSARLIVPEGSLEAYRNADYWKNFVNIQAVASIEDVAIDTNASFDIYNLNGVFLGNNLKLLSPGIYIINGKKVFVK